MHSRTIRKNLFLRLALYKQPLLIIDGVSCWHFGTLCNPQRSHCSITWKTASFSWLSFKSYPPYSLKYFSCLSFIIALLLSCTQHLSVGMAESSSDNPELTHTLKAVSQNILATTFHIGDDSTQPRWVYHQTLFDFAILTLFLSKRKCPLDPEDKENDASDSMSKNYCSFGCVYSRQSSPFNTVDSVVTFGIKHETLDVDGGDIERKTLTTQKVTVTQIFVRLLLINLLFVEKNSCFTAGSLFVASSLGFALTCSLFQRCGRCERPHVSKWAISQRVNYSKFNNTIDFEGCYCR